MKFYKDFREFGIGLVCLMSPILAYTMQRNDRLMVTTNIKEYHLLAQIWHTLMVSDSSCAFHYGLLKKVRVD